MKLPSKLLAAASCAALALSLCACGSSTAVEELAAAPEPQEQSAPEPEPVEEPEPEPEPAGPDYANAITYLHGGEIYLVEDGSVLPFSLEGQWTFGGRLSEGKVLVGHTTSDYDEQWQTETNVQTRWAFYDWEGNELFDVTDLANSLYGNAGVEGTDPVQVSGHFQDGIGYLKIERGGFAIIDEQGNPIVTSAELKEQYPRLSLEVIPDPDEFFGLLTAEGSIAMRLAVSVGGLLGDILLDCKTGEVLYALQDGESPEDAMRSSIPMLSHINGWPEMSFDDKYFLDEGIVYDWGGVPVFDPATLVGADYDGADCQTLSYDNEGAALLRVTKTVEGSYKEAYGIYDFVNGAWVVEPRVEENHLASGFRQGVALGQVKEGLNRYCLRKADGTVLYSGYDGEGFNSAKWYQGDWVMTSERVKEGSRLYDLDMLVNVKDDWAIEVNRTEV